MRKIGIPQFTLVFSIAILGCDYQSSEVDHSSSPRKDPTSRVTKKSDRASNQENRGFDWLSQVNHIGSITIVDLDSGEEQWRAVTRPFQPGDVELDD